jgi:hypothetical protein
MTSNNTITTINSVWNLFDEVNADGRVLIVPSGDIPHDDFGLPLEEMWAKYGPKKCLGHSQYGRYFLRKIDDFVWWGHSQIVLTEVAYQPRMTLYSFVKNLCTASGSGFGLIFYTMFLSDLLGVTSKHPEQVAKVGRISVAVMSLPLAAAPLLLLSHKPNVIEVKHENT